MKTKLNFKKLLVAACLFVVIATTISIPFAVMSDDYPQIDLALIGGADGKVSADLVLPDTVDGIDGTITWTAADEDLIAVENGKGRILKYDVDNPISTSVTAHISNGDSKEVDFDIVYSQTNNMEIKFEESFDGATHKGTLALQTEQSDSYAAHSDGQLILSKGAVTHGNDVALLYTLPSAYSGKFLLEFDTYFTADISTMRMQVQGGPKNNKAVVDLRFEKEGMKAFDNSTSTTLSGQFDFAQKRHIKVLLDTTDPLNGKFSVWYGDNLVAENFGCREDDGSVQVLRLFMASKAATVFGEAYLDNITVSVPSDIMAGADPVGIDEGVATRDIILPSVTTAGYSVEWTAADSNVVISENRALLNGSRTESTESGVIAKVEKDGVTYTKTYSFSLPVSTLPVMKSGGQPIYEENFNNITSYDKLKSGAKYSVNSSGQLEIDITGDMTMGSGERGTYIDLPEHNISDRLVYEFDLLCPDTTDKQLYMGVTSNDQGSRAAAGVLFSIGIENRIYATNAGSTDFDGTRLTPAHNVDNCLMHVIIEMRSSGRWSLWIDGIQWVNDDTMRLKTDLSDMRRLMFITTPSSIMPFTLDNIKVYQGDVIAKRDVDNLLASIQTIGDIAPVDSDGNITGNIQIEDNRGCLVVISDDENIVNSDGSFVFPVHSVSTQIEVIAEADGYTDSKSFDVVIPSNYVFGKVSLRGLNLGRYLMAKIPVELRREEQSGEQLKAELIVSDSQGEAVVNGMSKPQTVMVGENNCGVIGYINNISAQLPDNPSVTVKIYSSVDNYQKAVAELDAY